MPYRSGSNRIAYAPLLRRLVRLTDDTASALRALRKPVVSDRVLLAFLAKGADTLRGVMLLQKQGLCHEAQALARILFELRINFDAFCEMLAADGRSACIRLWDTVMLEKVKQARASGFGGLDLVPGAPTPEKLLASEKEIADRYTPSELAKLRKYGFSGMSVESRARKSGLSDEYNVAYRNFSRNVHSTDFTELFIHEDPMLIRSPGRRDSYLESRDWVCCELALTSVYGIAVQVNAMAGLGLDRRFGALTKAWEGVRRST